MDNNNKKDNKKESSIGGIIAFVIAIMVLLGDDLPGIFGILVVGAVIAVIIYAVSAAKKRQAKEGGTAQVTRDDIKTGARTGLSKVMTEMKSLPSTTMTSTMTPTTRTSTTSRKTLPMRKSASDSSRVCSKTD